MTNLEKQKDKITSDLIKRAGVYGDAPHNGLIRSGIVIGVEEGLHVARKLLDDERREAETKLGTERALSERLYLALKNARSIQDPHLLKSTFWDTVKSLLEEYEATK